MDRRQFLAFSGALATLPAAALPVAADDPVLDVRARVGPWPVISRLIGYKGRLWFANSVKWRNHNSADIWSLNPAGGEPRYERNLFSQDVGVPLVHRGFLYWPFEDSRSSLGWGMVEVTGGKNWQPLLVPTAEIFHSNSLVDWNGRLVAITSAWRLGIQMSENGGSDWHQFYDHPTPKGRLSRLHEPIVLADDLFGKLSDPSGARLVKFKKNHPIPVAGWPNDQSFFALTSHNGQIFAAVKGADGYHIWRTDGDVSQAIGNHPARSRLIDLAGDDNRLWAISQEKNGGHLWSSPDGASWTAHNRFFGGQPLSVDIIGGEVYVAGAGDDGRGILWGPSAPHHIAHINASADLPEQFSGVDGMVDWQRLGIRIDAAFSDISQYENHGRGDLRALVFDAVKAGAPPGFFAQRLKGTMPQREVQAFGGQLTMRAADLGQSILLWGMGLAKQKDIPVSMIKRPWRLPANSFEKYFDPQLTAIWAVAASGQNDRATIGALIERLDAKPDPLWLRGQVIGTLCALTGKKFAYDVKKWREWWASATSTWPEKNSSTL